MLHDPDSPRPTEALLHATVLRRVSGADLPRRLGPRGPRLLAAETDLVDGAVLDLGQLRLVSLKFRAGPVRLTFGAADPGALLVRAPANRLGLAIDGRAQPGPAWGDVALIPCGGGADIALETGGRLDLVMLETPAAPSALAAPIGLPLSQPSVKMLIYLGGYLLRAAPHRPEDAATLRRQFTETLQMALDHRARDQAFPTEIERLGYSMEAVLGDRELTLAGFARQVGMSARKVQAVFAAEGLTFSDVLRDKRLARARLALLHGPGAVKVAQVGLDCGFKDASYFAKCFRSRYGQTPNAVRRAAQGAQ